MHRALPSLSSLCLIHVLHYSPFTGFGSCVVGGWDKLAHGCYERNISPFQGCGDGQYLRTAAVGVEYSGSVWPGWEGSIKNAGGGERRTSVSFQEPIQRPALTVLETATSVLSV